MPDTCPQFYPNFKFLDTFKQNRPLSGRRLGSYAGVQVTWECTANGVAGSRQWVALQ